MSGNIFDHKFHIKYEKKFHIFGTFFNKIRHIGFPVYANVILTS